ARVYRDRSYKRLVCAVDFHILDSALIETVAELTWFVNLGNGERPKAGRRSNYWKAWVKANDGPPKRSDRITPHVFNNRYATVRVGDVASGEYSVVKDVVQWLEIGVRQKSTEPYPMFKKPRHKSLKSLKSVRSISIKHQSESNISSYH